MLDVPFYWVVNKITVLFYYFGIVLKGLHFCVFSLIGLLIPNFFIESTSSELSAALIQVRKKIKWNGF